MAEKNIFSFESILLLESFLKRSWTIDYEKPEFKHDIEFNVSNSRNETHLTVILDLKFTAGTENESQIESMIKMVGVFALPESSEIPIEKFAEINAPAIIFPYIREHLSSLSLKAGINPILLQPVNFVKHSENKASR